MKEEINLLAPSTKAERLQRLLGSRLTYIWRRVAVMMSLFVLLLVVAYTIFLRNKNLYEASLVESEKKDTAIQQDVSLTNEFLRKFEETAQTSRKWSEDTIEILHLIPPGIYLTAITARESDGALIIEGSAKQRTLLIEFQRHLEKLAWISRVEAPLKNFATDSSGSFTFTLFPKDKKI